MPTINVIRARPLLGTLVQIQASGPVYLINRAVDSAFAAIEHVQRLMSYHDPASELSMLNREAAFAAQRVHEDTYAVITCALRFAGMSGGAFEPCVGAQLENWGYLPTHGSPLAIGPQGRPDWRDVELLGERRVRFRRELRLDLGGVAKGYAVDLAASVLQEFGVSDALINAGGDIRVWGDRERGIELRHPLAPSRAAHVVFLRNAALATSGTYFTRQSLFGLETSALVDPRNWAPHLSAGSVSVRAADCLTADALTKVVLFALPGVAERTLAACDAEAFLQQPGIPGKLDSSETRMCQNTIRIDDR